MKKQKDIGVSWNVLSDYIEFGTSALNECGMRANNSEETLRRSLDYLTYLAMQVQDPPTLDAYRRRRGSMVAVLSSCSIVGNLRDAERRLRDAAPP